MSTETLAHDPSAAPRWRVINSIERRALGVLIEKAKTTPENYPLSLNALRAGCNQKSNRAPQMQLEEVPLEEALDSLRKLGAVSLVQGDSRVDRFRHLAYEWLGVDKVELAVMAELLLRGAQTVGELRGRAARMEPIKDLSELQPILASLEAKRLIAFLTPAGRGAIVTHTLYLDREMEKVRREAGSWQLAEASDELESTDSAASEEMPSRPEASRPRQLSDHSQASNASAEVAALRAEVAAMKHELESIRAQMESVADGFRRELAELNRQLGN